MRSISLALTWEFWRESAASFAIVIASQSALVAWLYWGFSFRGINPTVPETLMLTGVHAFCFCFIVVGLAFVVCQATASPTRYYALPVSVRTSVLIAMLNGMLATAVGYLAIAFVANGLFDAHWTLIKPVLMAISIISLCQAIGWTTLESPQLRGAVVAGLAGVLSVGMYYLNGNGEPGQFYHDWELIRPLDVGLAIAVPVLACTYSVITLRLARHANVYSLTALGRWLLARLESTLRSTPGVGATPMSAELWAEWTRRGQAVPASVGVVAAVTILFWSSGRFEWQTARDAAVALTGMFVIYSPLFGLFLGHVGARFDYNEHAATRPLSESQLADVKLRTTLKALCWGWIVWVIGIAIGVACLAIVGKGPVSWSDVVPPGTQAWELIILGVMPLGSWTTMSLAVSVSILRPWMIKAVCLVTALLPSVPMFLLILIPESKPAIAAISQWGWILLTISATIALYATALRLQLITGRRVAVVGVAYLSLCAIGLLVTNFLPVPGMQLPKPIGFLVSTCILPFVSIAAVPLAIWWNRHR